LQSISCRCERKAIKRLHGENCAELFGILETESTETVISTLRLFEVARVLLRLDHVASSSGAEI
jgi:hypothetical protein